ncbi:MAG: hypothetical protein ABF820_07460 [Sporolactobacillus sp.]
MRKIKDERLQLINLKNSRIAFLFQMIGLLAILFTTWITKGSEAAVDSPVFLLLMLTCSLLGFLQLRVSVDMEEGKKKRRKPLPYVAYVFIALATSLLMAFILYMLDRHDPFDALFIGAIFFICSLASYSVVYLLRKKHDKNDE